MSANLTPPPPGEPIVVAASRPWHETGRQLEKGRRYRLTVRVQEGEPYADQGIACTPDGPATRFGRAFDWLARDATSPLNPIHWFGPGAIKRLRVLHDRHGDRASFLTLMAALGRDDSEHNVYRIGRGREIAPHRDGELVLFVNDWPGGKGTSGEARFQDSLSYRNNRGALLVWIEPLAP